MKLSTLAGWGIPTSKTWQKVTRITEGWSHDEKFRIQARDGSQFLLRLSAKEDLEQEAECYVALQQASGKGWALPDLLATGLCCQGQKTYRLFSWVEGKDLRPVIASFADTKQYALGLQAGHLLQKIHQIPAPAHRTPWSIYYQEKIDKKIQLFQACDIDFAGSKRLIDFIATYRSTVAARPQCFHHGDYHIGNMLLTPEQQLAVIDFNRLDFGDPWDEFNRISWTAQLSPSFASGQVDGYFDHTPPKLFFELMALYIAVNQIGAIPWAVDYGAKEVQTILQQTAVVMDWFDGFSRTVPSWYQEGWG